MRLFPSRGFVPFGVAAPLLNVGVLDTWVIPVDSLLLLIDGDEDDCDTFPLSEEVCNAGGAGRLIFDGRAVGLAEIAAAMVALRELERSQSLLQRSLAGDWQKQEEVTDHLTEHEGREPSIVDSDSVQ